MGKLDGRHALVTGASKGIGAGIARAMALEGATVAVGYGSDEQGAARTVSDIEQGGGRAIAIQADVSQAADVQRMFGQASAEFGPIDVLVNNAGVFLDMPLADITAEEFHRQYNTNVLGLILTTQAFAAQAPPTGGSIANVLTAAISYNQPGSAIYVSSKAAAAKLSGVFADELAPQKIRVNAIAPAFIDTEGTRAQGLVGGDMDEFVIKATLLGRIRTTDDIAPVAVFLASEDAGWITGDVLFACGGFR